MPELLYDSCKIWEACRATSATATFFNPIAIGTYKQKFADGAIKHNNPIQLVYREAETMWPSRAKEAVLLSIGTGSAPLPPFEGNIVDILQALKHMAVQAELTADEFYHDHRYMTDNELLYRFNVFHGLAEVGLEEYKESRKIADATHAYMSSGETRRHWSKCLAKLIETDFDSSRAATYDRLPELLTHATLTEGPRTRWGQEVDHGPHDNRAATVYLQPQIAYASEEAIAGRAATIDDTMFAAKEAVDLTRLKEEAEGGAEIDHENCKTVRKAIP